MKTLVIVSHPYPEQSHIIKSLQQVALEQKNVTVRHLDLIYGENINGFDIETEQQAYQDVDRVIFMFPIHWFNLTPMLKAYLNQVWSYGWAFGPNGTALKNKEMMVVTSAGANSHTYSNDGRIHCTIDEVLTPMKASAYYVDMKYLSPLAFLGVSDTENTDITKLQQAFLNRLNTP